MPQRTAFALLAVLIVFATPAFAEGPLFRANLTGDEEVPNPVDTETTGRADFLVNRDATQLDFTLTLRDGVGILGGPGGHIHCAPFGQNGPIVAFLSAGLAVGFDGDVRIRATLNDANINDVGCGATVAELVESMRAGLTYVNIHSNRNPAGEVRGQIFAPGRGDRDDDDDDDHGDGDDDRGDDDDDRHPTWGRR